MDNVNTKDSEKNKKDKEYNIVDLLSYLSFHWKWYVLSLAVCIGFACFRYAKSPRTYFSSVQLLIKDSNRNSDADMQSMVGLNKYSNSINSVNVLNEMQVLLSKELLYKMVLVTNTDINYRQKKNLHVHLQSLYLKKN